MDYFRPYEGEKPFFFVSYSHRNSEFVLSVISVLREKNYRLWYDEGIPAGGDWPKNIAEHMRRCTAVLFFQSRTALASANCYNELKAAFDQGKTVFRIILDDAQPDESWSVLLQNAVNLSRMDAAAAVADQIAKAEQMAVFQGEPADYEADAAAGKRAGVLDILIAALLVALLAIGTGSYIQWKTAHPSEPEVIQKYVTEHVQVPEVDLGQWKSMLTKYIHFPDVQQENAVRNLLEIYDGEIESAEMENITGLYFCGNTSAVDGVEDAVYLPEAGWSIHGIPLTQGKVMDLSLIGQMLNLKKLSLVYQPVTNLEQLRNLPYLKELSLAGCESVSLETLPELASLEVLHLEHSGVTDLTALDSQPALRLVTVSVDMFPLVLSPAAEYDVLLVN